MPIIKVLGLEGEVLHDCVEAGCPVSWDGYALVEQTIDVLSEDEPGTKERRRVAPGERIPGAQSMDRRWRLLADGATVQATHA